MKFSGFKRISKMLADFALVGYDPKGENTQIAFKDFYAQLELSSSVGGGTPIYFTGTQLPSQNEEGGALVAGNWTLLEVGKTYQNINSGASITTPLGRWSIARFNGSVWILYDLGELPAGQDASLGEWNASKTYVWSNTGDQYVVYDGKLYAIAPNQTATGVDIPGTSNKWVPKVQGADIEPLESQLADIDYQINGDPKQYVEYKDQTVRSYFFGSRGNIGAGGIISGNSRAGYVLLTGFAPGTEFIAHNRVINFGNVNVPLYAFTDASNTVVAIDVSPTLNMDVYDKGVKIVWPNDPAVVNLYINTYMVDTWNAPDPRYSVRRVISSGFEGIAGDVEKSKENISTLQSDVQELKNSGFEDISDKALNFAIVGMAPYSNEVFAASMFFAKRFALEVAREAIAGRKNLYMSSDGSDSNNGLTQDAPIKTITRLQALLANGDSVFLKRGSVFEDYGVISNKNNILMSVFGTGANPVFNNLVTIPSASIEKVAGYTNVYRFQRAYDAAVASRGIPMVYVDGKRCGRLVTDYQDMTQADALAAIDANPGNGTWFSGGRYSSGWAAGTYYMYFSLADSPANHKIESVNKWSSILEFTQCTNVDIRHVDQRGSGFRDGVAYGSTRNFFCEDCGFLDHGWHGVLYEDMQFHKCRVISRSGAFGYQFHWQSKQLQYPNMINSSPTVISAFNLGAAFNGHNTATPAGQNEPYQNMVVDNAYIEGTDVVCRSGIVEKTHYNKVFLKNVSSLCGGLSDRDTIISDSVAMLRRYVQANELSIIAPYILPGKTLEIRDTSIFVQDDFGRYSLMHTTSNLASGVLTLENVTIIIKCSAANAVAPLFRNTSLNGLPLRFKNVLIACEKPTVFNHAATTLAASQFEDCIFMNLTFNGINLPASNQVFNNFDEIKKAKYKNRLSYIQNNVLKLLPI